ncbi:hypothetical protein IWX84_003042 [Flavobacterium sp. CG_9.10]|uniref:hypothetical protein n=1 Tax=Flavobacterium sp. CG_9.10 TaxID=2787729 RepID=UPI0018C8EE5D|nr:hypothetical protein [Flavobacterium sp. CG_9.10]MBG6112143.1 hypothetical protein [Flavobacterium sp. CG_9.10]
MKIKYFLLIFFLFESVLYCQDNSNKNLIIFKTYEDFVSNSGINLGIIVNYLCTDWGANKIVVKNGSQEEKINMNKYWGFKIDNYIFRMNKDGLRLPLFVFKNNEKVFYIDGYINFDKIAFGSDGYSIRESDGCFYSDNLNSEVFEITKIIKKEKYNPKLKDLITCIKRSKKRAGYQSQFNGYIECLK